VALAALVALTGLYLAIPSTSFIDDNETLIGLKVQPVQSAAIKVPSKPVRLEVYYLSDECRGENVTTLQAHPNGPPATVHLEKQMPKSMRVLGQGELQLFNDDGNYVASVVELEGCVKLFPWPGFTRGELTHGAPSRRVDLDLLKKVSTASDLSKPHTRIVFSCESAEYFGYQAVTNAYAFLQSNQTEASWLRLLTAHMSDDLSESLPTFQAPRTLYSKQYSPYNKPDIIDKWFNSEHDAPHPDDTIVVIDPDNWLLKDVQEWTLKVSRKHAYGQVTYYSRNKKIQQLWKEVCKAGCNNTVDAVGVPYVLAASDLKEVAPLWRMYTVLLNELQKDDKERFDKEYNSLYMGWTSEMFGYNFACAHLSIKTTVVDDLQVRDVDNSRHMSKEQLAKKSMIHMGRAWFPQKHAALAEKWRHTEGERFKSYGIQVWCKCNNTGSSIVPWPLPDGLDFQSYHTLRLLHEAKEWFGPIPKNDTFRKEANYFASIP
jgi:hypothetical protein